MSYIDNLAGAFKTTVDALNSKDQFRMVSDLAKGRTPSAGAVPTSYKGRSGLGDLVATGGLALLAVAALAFFSSMGGSARSQNQGGGDEQKNT